MECVGQARKRRIEVLLGFESLFHNE